jgi:hypothetical protein
LVLLFGATFATEHEDAWTRPYDAVRRNMIAGAAE